MRKNQINEKHRKRVYKSKKRYRRKRRFIIVFFLFVIAILGFFYIKDRANVADDLIKTTVNPIFKPISKMAGYDAESLLLVNIDSGEVVASKDKNDKLLPASLAKLFVIEFVDEHTTLEETVKVNNDALKFVKKGSSVANLEIKDYTIENLFAAMLVPSGNDAAYVLADYVGGKLDKNAKTTEERIEVFVEGLNEYLREKGYKNTVIYDPSGYDSEATSSANDLNKVSKELLKKKWFRKIISQHKYVAKLADKSEQIWQNTNEFLNKKSKYYSENVLGVKTGSLDKIYNIVVLYKSEGKEFLICNVGSKTSNARYEDVKHIIDMIDELSYLDNTKLHKK